MTTYCITNVTVNLQYGALQITYNIRRIKRYKLDTNFEYYYSINMYEAVNI